ncbi:hypothetical protein FACS1894192_09350 [Bacilli bacterium]|nr:hypothetical protein FACS1894192_09350 [Bacilli bacterium]
MDVNGKFKGTQEWQNNADNQLLEITSDKGATYEYDANGHVSQKRSSLGEVTIYQYDVEGRLIQESSTWGKQTYYTYDALGNRISKGTATEYDRKLKTDMMSWMKATDREAQLRLEESDITLSDILTKLTKNPAFISYCLPIKDRTWRIDHDTNRRKVTEEKLKKAVDTTVMIDTIEYLNDYTQTYVSPLQEQYTTYDKKVKSTYQATNFYNNNGMAIGNDLDTYHQDGLKSNITQISKENGRLYSSNLYKEFGSSERRIQDQAGYRSQYHDNSADIHLRAREYNTTTGRFLQQDTVLGSLKNPTTQNKYIYGNNNPFMYRDDAGRFGWKDLVNGVKKVVKTVAKAVDKYIIQPVVKAVKYVANAVGNFVSNVFHSAQQVYNKAVSSANQAINYVSNQVQQGYNQAVDWVETKAAQAQAAYQQAVAIAQETRAKAEARIRKMCEGASAVWNSATKAVDNFVKKHEGAIKLALGAGVIILSIVNPPAGLAAGMALSAMELGSAVTGKDWVSNREMSDKERLTTGVLSVVSMGMGGSAIYNEVKSVASAATTTTQSVVGSVAQNVDDSSSTVGRWMSQTEYDKMAETGRVQVSPNGNTTYVANPSNSSAFPSAPKGSLYVEFDVATETLKPAGKVEWSQIPGPNSLYDKLGQKQGLPPITEMPPASNLTVRGGGLGMITESLMTKIIETWLIDNESELENLGILIKKTITNAYKVEFESQKFMGELLVEKNEYSPYRYLKIEIWAYIDSEISLIYHFYDTDNTSENDVLQALKSMLKLMKKYLEMQN